MKVTLHEVAARADVSIATVSRALNGLPVSKENLARVRKAVADLGYVANEAARALRSDRTQTMGLVFFDLANTLGIDLLDSLSECIEDAGYSLLISTARGDDERYDVLMHRFLERRVDALFCVRPRGEAASLARYTSARIPVITLFSSGGAFAGLPLFTPAFNDAAKAVSDHLEGLGHKRIALVRRGRATGPMTALGERMKAQGLQVDVLEPGEEGGMSDVITSIMAKKNRATAVIAADPLSRGLMAACAAAGVRVPEDLSLISISELSADTRQKKHAISALVIEPSRLGRTAGVAMLGWLAGSPPAERVRVPGGTFFPRATTGKAPSAR